MVVITEIEDRRMKKPFLGAYRHKITSKEYFNAASQTGPRRKDLFIPNTLDRYLTVKSYESHEEMEKRLNLHGHARKIQKSYRAYRLLKHIKNSAKEYRDKIEECRKLENERAEAQRKRHQREILRQTFPRSRGDFDKLYNLIDRWRSSRLDFTKKRMFSGSTRAENSRLLEETTSMLKSMENHRQLLIVEKREKKRIRFLTENCKPIKWNGYKAMRIEMTTLRVQKAREYKIIYDNLMKKETSVENRMELLLLLKNSLKNHSCINVDNFIRLLDQEISLISSGIKSTWLNNLRQRISIAYLNFVNESGSCTCILDNDYQSSVDNTMTLISRTKKLLCKGCLKILPYRYFSAHVRMKKLSCCLSCSWLRQQNIDKSDYGPYTFLLNGIRADEQRRNCYSSLLWVIREPGIYHLVNNIWHGHSIISENDDIFNLRLVRFNIDEEWSPWNCILLTSEEAETHYYVKDFENFYSKRLLHKIYLTHQIAKTHFRELISFEKKFRESSRYYVIQDREEYEPKSES